jgi:CRP/FNR family transcriptional regulator, cyclic AMP receptor protein
MLQSCQECVQRSDRFFCDLPLDALAAFDGIKSFRPCPKGTLLFREGQAARGVYLVCQGRVRLSVCSENGGRMTLRIAGPGEVLGLSAALAGGACEVTAQAIENGRVALVRRKDLLRFLRDHRDICMQVVSMLSEDLHLAYDRVRAVGLGRTRHHRAELH